MDFMICATELNAIGKLIYNVLYKWVQGWGSGISWIGPFGITVILFTLLLKLITSPFDVWQKVLTRKNAKLMEIMKPELDKAAKQCGDNRELLMQKQRDIYKKHNYSMFSSCLPMIITLAIFITVFNGFNSAVKHYNSSVFEQLQVVYEQSYDQKSEELADAELTAAEKRAQATLAAEQAVVDYYEPEKILLTTNIFMPDTWANPIPTAEDYSGKGIGKLNIPTDKTKYDKVMKPILEKYNRKGVWNGYLILPILSFVLNIFSTKLMGTQAAAAPPVPGQTEEQKKAQEAQQKMMTFLMPIMMAVFALFYSTAFTLYLLFNSAVTTVFNLIYNRVAKVKDAKEKDHYLSTTLK
jgi:YidC/Oxa1 family membrane protein insertase